jgi:hypothetical protein
VSAPVITREIAEAAVNRVWRREFPNAFVPVSVDELISSRRPLSDRETAAEVFQTEFARARKLGLDVELAAKIASAEVRLALRRGPAHAAEAPHRARNDAEMARARPMRDCPCVEPFDLQAELPGLLADIAGTAPRPDHPAVPHGPYESDRSAEHVRFAVAEADFGNVVNEDTGDVVVDEVWSERKADREELRQMSHRIANSLELGGTVAYRTDEYQMHIWNVFSGVAELVPAFRRLCIIPHVAAMVRAQKLVSLEYFLDRHPLCRFWTFTSGKRVPMSGLRERIEALHARLNALNKELRRIYGCELVFRSTELGTIETPETAGIGRRKRAARIAHNKAVKEAKAAGRPAPVWTRAKAKQYEDDAGKIERDETTGELMFHPHAHCVFYSPRGALPKAEWSEMLRFVWAHWGDHWDEGKIISDAREACKYVTKPGEIAALEPADLCALEKALHGLRLVTPMGVLREEIAARRAAGETLRRKQTDDGPIWRVVPDHNKQLSKTEAEKAQLSAMQRAEALDRMDFRLGNACEGKLRRKPSGTFCRVVARLAPAAVVTPLKEPRVITMSSRGGFSESAVRSHPLTVKVWNQGIQSWTAGRAIRVHTGTSTGETRAMTLLAETDERFAPATEPVWEASIPAVPVGLN